jgi:hypothetical protein
MRIPQRKGVSNLAALGITVIVILAVFAFAYIYLAPGSSLPKLPQQSTTSQTGIASGCAQGVSIVSTLYTYNSVTATDATIHIFQNGAPIFNDPGSVTAGTQTSATSQPYSLPWSATFGASGFYNTSFTTPSTYPQGGINVQDSFGNPVGSIICNIPSGNQINSVPYWSMGGKVFKGPASGTSANTNVEAVLNSQTSQTNSFPAAFPTSAPQNQIEYLQIFSTNTAGLRPMSLFGTSTTVRTDYGGINGETAGSSQVSNGGQIFYGGYMIAVFNQTAISFTGPAGTAPLTVHGQTGEIAYMVPLSGCQPSGSSSVSTSNPYLCAQVSFSVQETIAATGHHVSMVLIFVDGTQGGYISQYFNAPAVTSFPSAGNSYGIPTGFSGIVPPSSANPAAPLIEQYSAITATY